MSTQRRFTEKEIARIFEKATRAQNAANDESHSNEGLSLEELKQIGASTGIDADYIVQAIAELNEEARGLSIQKHMGVPYALSRSVKLPDTFSEKDWERLVVDLRRTFKTRGTIKQDGSFREWSHGYTHGISKEQFNVLRILRGKHPDPSTIQSITERMISKSSNATRLVEKLRVKGLVERVQCSDDRRKVDVVITEAGLKLLTVVDPLIRASSGALETNITDEEAQELNRILDRLRG